MRRIRARLRASDLQDIRWIKSSHSGPTGGNCVEAAFLPDGAVAVRNSRHRGGPALVFTAGEWDAFVKGAADGEFTPPPR
jgi:Domain of unknown function (DUF397)